jgi:geranylgeranyl pyrophosphate synthase
VSLEESFPSAEVSGQLYTLADHIIMVAREGKRLRPYIAMFEATRFHDVSIDTLVPVLFGIELFHLFALIHDDIIDDAPKRHGVITIHKKFSAAQALLAGDWCMSLAVECMMSVALPQETRTYFSLLMRETISGQMLETDQTDCDDIYEEMLTRSVEYKTTRYTILYPMMLGRTLAGFSDCSAQDIQFVRILGNVFQRIDDLSDILEDEVDLGRPPGTDISQGVHTHLSTYIHSSNDPDIIRDFDTFFGRKLSTKDISALRELLHNSGVVAHEKALLLEKLQQAQKLKDFINDNDKSIASWRAIIQWFMNRLDRF